MFHSILICFVSIPFFSFCFVSFQFVLFCFDFSFRSLSFLIRFARYRDQLLKHPCQTFIVVLMCTILCQAGPLVHVKSLIKAGCPPGTLFLSHYLKKTGMG